MKLIEKIVDFLQTISDKYLIDVVTSLVLSAVIYLVTNDGAWIIRKMTLKWYYFFCAGCVFLLFQFSKHLKCNMKKFLSVIYKITHKKQIEEKQKKEELEHLWELVDRLNEDRRMVIKQLVKNGNAEYVDEYKILKHDNPYDKLISYFFISQECFNGMHLPYYRYKLKDDIYKLLSYSYEKYGRISNFD